MAEATEIGGTKAEGAELRFLLDGRPANTFIHWPVVNKRLVLLFFTRPYENAEKTSACWDTIRKSLKVERGK